MGKVNIEAAQNVEISKKIPCEKPLREQLKIMERYMAVHRAHLDDSKELREAACLEVLYPTLPVSDVIQFLTRDGDIVSARPSGTEPKIRFYFSTCGPDAREKAARLRRQFGV